MTVYYKGGHYELCKVGDDIVLQSEKKDIIFENAIENIRSEAISKVGYFYNDGDGRGVSLEYDPEAVEQYIDESCLLYIKENEGTEFINN